MEIVFLLLPLSLLLLALVLWAVLFAVRSGQFEDLEGPAYRILLDDDRPAGAGSGGPVGNNRQEAGAGGDAPPAHGTDDAPT